MDLREDPSLILAYVEGQMPEDEAHAFEQRLESDASLAALVRDMREDRAGLRALGEEVPEVSPADAVLAQVERRLLLGEATEAGTPSLLPPSGAAAGGHPVLYRILRYGTVGGLAAALGLTAFLVVNNLTGTPLEQRARELAVLPDAAESEAEATADLTATDGQALAMAENVEVPATVSSRAARQRTEADWASDTPASDVFSIDALADATPMPGLRPSAPSAVKPSANTEMTIEPFEPPLHDEAEGEVVYSMGMGIPSEVDSITLSESPAASVPMVLEIQPGRTQTLDDEALERLLQSQVLSRGVVATASLEPAATDARSAPVPKLFPAQFQSIVLPADARDVLKQRVPAETYGMREPAVPVAPVDPRLWLDPAYWLGPAWPEVE